MSNLGLIISFSLNIGVLLVFFIFSAQNYRQKFRRRFSFLQEFPYEFIDNGTPQYRASVFLYSGAALAAVSFLYFFFDFRIVHAFWLFPILVLVPSLFLVLLIVRPSQNRVHLIIYFLINFLMIVGVSGLLFYYRPLDGIAAYLPLQIVVLVTVIIFVLFFAFLTINPRLYTWARLERVVDENGNEQLVRPKVFSLAFGQWLSFGGFELFILVLFILKLIR